MTLGSIRLAAQILTLTLKLESWELMRAARWPPDPDPDPERFRVRGSALMAPMAPNDCAYGAYGA